MAVICNSQQSKLYYITLGTNSVNWIGQKQRASWELYLSIGSMGTASLTY